ncbi:hypothetical protein ABZX40_35390 [Streptomyces sp. NPDC004610]|uniref:hypothetical protein n=1 Tax=unclassified Streptomyces TaxID=2593676 RepID=UPI0033BEC82B
MTAGWCSRTIRAALFAAVCVLLAALGHVMMSGSRVPGWTLAAALAATGAAGWCLAGRERGPGLVVTVAVLTQTLLHSGFSLAQSATGAGGAGGVGGAGAGTAPVMGHATMGSASMGSASMGSMDHMEHLGHAAVEGSSSLGMYAAHLLAALLSGLWLAFGERAAFRILRTVAGRLAAPLRLLFGPVPLTDAPPSAPARRRDTGDAACSLLLVHAITSRGPPVGTAVV